MADLVLLPNVAETDKLATLKSNLDDKSAKTIQNDVKFTTCKTVDIETIKSTWSKFFEYACRQIEKDSSIKESLPRNNPELFLSKIKSSLDKDGTQISDISFAYLTLFIEYLGFVDVFFDVKCANSGSSQFSLDTITKDTNSMMYAGGILAIGGIIGYFIGKK